MKPEKEYELKVKFVFEATVKTYAVSKKHAKALANNNIKCISPTFVDYGNDIGIVQHLPYTSTKIISKITEL